eukprot:m.114893 g.114893  ORF g.114893 m.114893 type:complete len:753 (-) comp9284_c1_seq6:294-2552(-)
MQKKNGKIGNANPMAIKHGSSSRLKVPSIPQPPSKISDSKERTDPIPSEATRNGEISVQSTISSSSSDVDGKDLSVGETEEKNKEDPTTRDRGNSEEAGKADNEVGIEEDDGHNISIFDTSSLGSKSESIRVVVRVRPLNMLEAAQNEKVFVVPQKDAQTLALFERGTLEDDSPRTYTFHSVFGPSSTQGLFFNRCGIKALIQSAMNGYACTAFAYGQTGGGKTHTISGDGGSDVGIVQLGMQFIWSEVSRRKDTQFSFFASYLEIYNEHVHDLLNLNSGVHPVRWKAEKGFFVDNLYRVECLDVESMFEVLSQGLSNRKTASHNMNERSSRSHTILRIEVESTIVELDSISQTSPNGTKESVRYSPESIKRYGQISFVDLAGSERIGKTGTEGQTLVESQNINKSLLTLGNCIQLLADPRHRKGHIPYRDSTLTMLLKESLGGNGLTLMISCVSPSKYSVQESQNTLRYASRAKRIQNKPMVFMDPKQQELLALRKEVKLLRSECAFLRTKATINNSNEVGSTLPKKYQEKVLREMEDEGENGIAMMARELTQAKILLQQMMQENAQLRLERDTLAFGQLSPSNSLLQSSNSSSSFTMASTASGHVSRHGSTTPTPMDDKGKLAPAKPKRKPISSGGYSRKYKSTPVLPPMDARSSPSLVGRGEYERLDSQYFSSLRSATSSAHSYVQSHRSSQFTGTLDVIEQQRNLGPSLRTGRGSSEAQRVLLEKEKSALDDIDAQIAMAVMELHKAK